MAKSSPTKRIFTVILVLAIGSATWFYFHQGEQSAPIFTTTKTTQGDISQIITASGSLEPVISIEVGSQVSGLVTAVFVDFNSPVKAGQLIAKIDTATYDQNLKQAAADLASSQANHSLVRLNTERTRSLRGKNLVTQQELDQAEATLAQADAALLTREATVENAKVDLSRCSIYAPIDGIVLDRQVEVGKTVAASLNSPVLFIIAGDLAQMRINAAIAEADIGTIAEGQRVDFDVDAFPTDRFRGRVVQIRNSPTTESNVVTYETIIAVRNDQGNLKPGMTANVSVVVASRTGVRRIANSALRVRMPKSLLPETTTKGDNTEAKGKELSDSERRAQYMKLMKDAGFERGSGPPSPEVRARMAALAKERGIEMPSREGSRAERQDSSKSTTRTVYKLEGSAEKPEVVPVEVKLGITDAITTEVLEGLDDDDVIITSALIPNSEGKAGKGTTNPFSSGMGRGRR